MSDDASSRARVVRAVASALAVREGEGLKTALLFAHLLVASSIFILGRTVRDTLFLSRYPLSALPWMFVLYGVASALTVIVYAQVADRMPRARLIVLSCAIGAVTYVGTYVAVKAGLRWIYPVFYVWSEVAANLFIVQFWTFANDLNDSRSARRLFPLVGSARVLGVVLIGLVTGAIVDLLGTEQLLLVLVGLMGVIVALALALRRFAVTSDGPNAILRRAPTRAPAVTRSPYVRALSVFLLLTFVVLTIGDYQFKAIARATFQEDDLARYFSLFYAGTGLVSFAFQVFVTPRVLRRLGVGWGMGVMPGVFGAASLTLLFVPHLAVATVMKFADNGFQYTIHETTLQALYVPFAESVKARTRAFLDAVVKPASYGAGGLVLALLAPRVDVIWLSAVSVGLVVFWFATIPWVRRRYVGALEKTLGLHGALSGGLANELGSEAKRVVRALLETGDARGAAVALQHLEGPLPPELVPAVERLALHSDARARRAALGALSVSHGVSAEPILAALSDPDATLRSAAVDACGPVLGDGCIEPLVATLDDADPQVRAQALAGILTHGGVEGAIVGGRRLAELIRSDSADERVEACAALGGLGRAAYRPLHDLLTDPSADVRRRALRAAVHVADPRLVPLLVDALPPLDTRGRAAAALVAIGEPAVPSLLTMLADESTPRSLTLVLPRLLRRIPCEAAFEGLRVHASHPDGHVRLRVLSAMATIHARRGAAPIPLAETEALVEAELRHGYHRMAAWERARPEVGTELLDLAHRFYAERTSKRVLRILSMRYDKRALDLVRKGVAHASRRGNALELLDGVLEPGLRARVMPWFDDVPIAERVARAGDLLHEVPTPMEYLRASCAHHNPYYVAIALDAVAAHPSPEGAELASRALDHLSPLARELALVALAVADPPAAARAAARLASDPSPVVRARAARVLDPEDGAPMRTTLEKVLALKSARVFSQVEAEDLAAMAHAAEEHAFDAGATIVEEGEVGDVLFLLLSGRVTVQRSGTTLATLGPGETFGEMAVLDAEPRSATVVAEEATECLAIASDDFYDVLREQSEIAEGVIRVLTHRLREADRAVDPVSMMPPSRSRAEAPGRLATP
ncbi:MAG: cyclic nucleotide-binding domain-containing protein [Sandaracinaceae bacterium]|nr:cyclic nucleotide-binding domain-containing protein [Sandaracinaceae bacterium]